jgi:hypothetical protein
MKLRTLAFVSLAGAALASIVGLVFVSIVGFIAVNLSMSTATIAKVSSLYDDAAPQIFDNLQNSNIEGLTQQQLESIISAAVKKAIDDEETNSGLTFEVLTCKLTVEWSYAGSWGKLTAGEINLCKVTAVVTASVLACKKFEFLPCAKAQLNRVERAVIREVSASRLVSISAVAAQRAAEREADFLKRLGEGDPEALRELESGRVTD